MHRTFIILAAFALTGCAQPFVKRATVVHGRVADVALQPVAGAHVRGFHAVPTEWSSDPQHPQCDGFLGETHSDVRGKFALPVSDRASLDYILAERGSQFGVARQPFSGLISIVIHPYSRRSLQLRRERQLQRDRKSFTTPSPNPAMQPTAGRSDASLIIDSTLPLQFSLAPASGG